LKEFELNMKHTQSKSDLYIMELNFSFSKKSWVSGKINQNLYKGRKYEKKKKKKE
jgi:hypothetical protein